MGEILLFFFFFKATHDGGGARPRVALGQHVSVEGFLCDPEKTSRLCKRFLPGPGSQCLQQQERREKKVHGRLNPDSKTLGSQTSWVCRMISRPKKEEPKDAH